MPPNDEVRRCETVASSGFVQSKEAIASQTGVSRSRTVLGSRILRGGSLAREWLVYVQTEVPANAIAAEESCCATEELESWEGGGSISDEHLDYCSNEDDTPTSRHPARLFIGAGRESVEALGQNQKNANMDLPARTLEVHYQQR